MIRKFLFGCGLDKICTFKAGGIADKLIVADDEKDIREILNVGDISCVVGGASNTVFTDNGVRGTVLCIRGGRIKSKGEFVTAGAGVSMARISSYCKEASLSGAEFMCGIPGTVGGGIVMNAGAFSGEMSDIVYSVKAHYGGKTVFLSGGELAFGYRKSLFTKPGFVITEAVFRLAKGEEGRIAALVEDYKRQRALSQPSLPSAGCVFLNGVGEKPYSAGRLIDEAGLKGFSIGGAAVSKEHANIFVNRGGATARDLLNLIDYTKEKVYNSFQTVLETKIKFIGN